jgi:hypothetical protein
MFCSRQSTKEHVMKRLVATVFAALLVALAVASVASAHRCARVAPAHLHHRAAV